MYVRHKYGKENPSYVKTALVIPETALDKKKKEVKSREGDDSDFRDKFRQIETQRQLLLDKLNNHEIQPNDILEKVKLYHTVDGYSIRSILKKSLSEKKVMTI